MKKFIIGALLCTISHSNFAMMLQLPDASTLRNRLYRDDATFVQLDEQKQNAIIDLLAGEKPFAALPGLLSTAANLYPITREISISLERKALLAQALLEDYPESLHSLLSTMNLAIKKITPPSRTAPRIGKAIMVQLPNAATLKARLSEEKLNHYINALEPHLPSFTNDSVHLEELLKRLQPMFENYHKYLTLMKIEYSNDTIDQDNQKLTKLLVKDTLPYTKINVAIKQK
jgi:hypothetical protein